MRQNMKRKTFKSVQDFHPSMSKRQRTGQHLESDITSTSNVQESRKAFINHEGEPLELSKIDHELMSEIPDVCNISEGKTTYINKEYMKHTNNISMLSRKQKKKKEISNKMSSTQSHQFDTLLYRNNDSGHIVRNESLGESKSNNLHSDVEALNSSVTKKKSELTNVMNSNLSSTEISDDKRRKKSLVVKNKIKLSESAVVMSDLSINCAEDEMHSETVVQHQHNGGRKMSSKKKKMKVVDKSSDLGDSSMPGVKEMYSKRKKFNDEFSNTDGRGIGVMLKNRRAKKHSVSSVDCICSELSDKNNCIKEKMQSKTSIDVYNNKDRKHSDIKKNMKKHGKSSVAEYSDISANNSETEGEVHSKIPEDKACNNKSRKKSATGKKKFCMLPIDIDSAPLDINNCGQTENIKSDPKRRKKTNCPDGLSTDLSVANSCSEDENHSGTFVKEVNSRKKKTKLLKTTINEQHHDLTSDFLSSDTDYCTCAVDESSARLVKQSTSDNVKSHELFEFPSKDESFHLHSDQSIINSIYKAKEKTGASIATKFDCVDICDDDILLMYSMMNKFCFADDVILKLKNLNISLHHHVYPLHNIDAQPCKIPKKSDKKQFSMFNARFGQFTEKEDKILRKNWKKFSEEYGFEDPEPFTDFSHKLLPMEKRRDFLQYLGKGLPDRPLYLIFNHFKYLMQHQNKGPFSEKEDALILKTIQTQVPNPYSFLSRILKRNRQSIYKRFKFIQDSSFTEKGRRVIVTNREKWSISLAELVVKSLAKVMKVSSIKMLKDIKIPARKWRKVEKLAKVRYDKLKQFWKYRLHVQLFAESPINENKIFKKIIRWLHRLNPSSVKDIHWKDSIYLFPGSTEWFMWDMFRSLRRQMHCNHFKKLEDFINFLYKNRKELRKGNIIERYLVNEDFSLSVLR